MLLNQFIHLSDTDDKLLSIMTPAVQQILFSW